MEGRGRGRVGREGPGWGKGPPVATGGWGDPPKGNCQSGPDPHLEALVICILQLEINFASRCNGVRLPRASGKSPDFPGSSPAASAELLPPRNLTAIQRFRGSLPDFPRLPQKFPRLLQRFPANFSDFPASSPDFAGSSRATSPQFSPFVWEA